MYAGWPVSPSSDHPLPLFAHTHRPASSQKQKLANWATLNHKVLRKIKHHVRIK